MATMSDAPPHSYRIWQYLAGHEWRLARQEEAHSVRNVGWLADMARSSSSRRPVPAGWVVASKSVAMPPGQTALTVTPCWGDFEGPGSRRSIHVAA